MLSVQHLTILHRQDQCALIRDCSFTLAGEERLAVIGEEGDGKSTLLRAICAPEEIAGYAQVEGQIRTPGERLAWLPQEAPAEWRSEPVWALCQRQEGFGALTPAEIHERCRLLSMEEELCWRDTPFGALSGGERVQLRLLLALCGKPSLLVLDEPGNDLDLHALEALEGFLLHCGLPVLYVSHDERLLENTATQILHLESLRGRAEPRCTLSRIPYGDYVRERQLHAEAQEKQWQMERREERAREEKLSRIENAVDTAQDRVSRRDPHKARMLKKKMKAVKSLRHRYERESEDRTERPWQEIAMDAAFAERPPLPAGRGVLTLDLPELTAGERVLARNVRLQLRGPDKVLIVGRNGCGKTTLLRAAEEALRAEGRLRVACMPQRYEELLPDRLSPVEFLHTRGDKEQLTRIRLTLGAMRMTRDEMSHPIGALSGGQKAKVLLLRLMLEEPDVLVMDEPTRNLSPLSAPVMRRIVCGFPGAVICVTHDRVLMEQWPGRILLLTAEGLAPYSP